ncbi:hypothetical protein DsansV1_C13g0121131 [Dioscorea sansibarensis]
MKLMMRFNWFLNEGFKQGSIWKGEEHKRTIATAIHSFLPENLTHKNGVVKSNMFYR